MEKLMVFWLLFAGLNVALAAEITQYFMEGGKLTLDLRPPSSEPINYILWKFKGNLLGEWVKGVVELTYYSTFIGRTALDTNTGRLEISEMTKADVGLYSVEINNKLQADQYKAVSIKAVPKPEVVIRPLTCTSTSESCSATCEGDTTDAGPVTYSWKMGDGEWKESGKAIDVTKADTADVKTFTCRVKNPLTESESDSKDNPLFGKDESGGLGVGGIVGIVILVLILGGAAVMGVLWRLKKCPFKNRGSTSPDAEAVKGVSLKDKETPGVGTATENSEPPKGTAVGGTAAENGLSDTPDEETPLKTSAGGE